MRATNPRKQPFIVRWRWGRVTENTDTRGLGKGASAISSKARALAQAHRAARSAGYRRGGRAGNTNRTISECFGDVRWRQLRAVFQVGDSARHLENPMVAAGR